MQCHKHSQYINCNIIVLNKVNGFQYINKLPTQQAWLLANRELLRDYITFHFTFRIRFRNRYISGLIKVLWILVKGTVFPQIYSKIKFVVNMTTSSINVSQYMTISLSIALMKCIPRVVFVMYNSDNYKGNFIYNFTVLPH